MPSPRTIITICRVLNIILIIVLMVIGYWLAFWHHNDSFGRHASLRVRGNLGTVQACTRLRSTALRRLSRMHGLFRRWAQSSRTVIGSTPNTLFIRDSLATCQAAPLINVLL